MLLVDTNVLVDVLQNDPQSADGSIAQMRAQAKLHALAIKPVIYAEMWLCFSTIEALDDVVLTMTLEVREIPRPALFLAAKAFAQYRRRGGSKAQVPPDYFIGAHAAVEGWPLLTRDASRFRTYFPTLDVVAPWGGTCGGAAGVDTNVHFGDQTRHPAVAGPASRSVCLFAKNVGISIRMRPTDRCPPAAGRCVVAQHLQQLLIEHHASAAS